jgi:hypothetical protein
MHTFTPRSEVDKFTVSMIFATLEGMLPYYLALLSFNIEVKMGGKEVQDATVTAKLHKSHACRHLACAQVPFMVSYHQYVV